MIKISEYTNLVFGYPVIPWVGLMALGYVMGSLYAEHQSKERTSLLMKFGIYSVLAFIVLRLTNFYGEPNHFAIQENISSLNKGLYFLQIGDNISPIILID